MPAALLVCSWLPALHVYSPAAAVCALPTPSLASSPSRQWHSSSRTSMHPLLCTTPVGKACLVHRVGLTASGLLQSGQHNGRSVLRNAIKEGHQAQLPGQGQCCSKRAARESQRRTVVLTQSGSFFAASQSSWFAGSQSNWYATMPGYCSVTCSTMQHVFWL